ncbi:chain length determinant protein EpsF [Propionivibrio sp.]|uniref:chain length determinant protein EpsF n=1 Tax=Propionivibrio sp. TaxID=2212460 RepID=UPI0025FB7461|nr:chain length determinant protein EpsF [Propionivibrio sp.]MBK8744414.1 chain length determinant protein EpsF [Propionivibrio sp.]MBL0206873.1 chain length determinant protein EpsF [Propionivibrio sp.]
MTFLQLLLTLRARIRVMLTIVIGTMLTALAVSLVIPKKFTAGTAMVIDVKSPDPIAGMVLPGMISPSYMATQVDIINSDRVAQRAVKLLHLADDPSFRQKWQDATEGKGELGVWLANELQKKLDVKPARESNVININFSGPEPTFVASAANAFAQAYIDVNLELKVEPARQNAAWFEGQTRLVRERLEAAQQAYSDYQQKSGIVASDERLDSETARLNELSTQLAVVQGQSSESHSKSLAAGDAGTLSEVLQNPLINSLKADISRLESKLQESNINLGKNHPQTLRSQSELASLNARLASETRKIIHSIGTAYEVSKQNESGLRDAIEKQKARLLGVSRQRDDISVLKRDVEMAQRAFEEVSLRTSQTRLESLSVLTNVIILNPAFVPTEHASPKILLNVLLSLFLGTLFGGGYALMQELANVRVRSTSDLALALKLPVLAAIPHAAAPSGRRRGRFATIFKHRSPYKPVAWKAATSSSGGARP